MIKVITEPSSKRELFCNQYDNSSKYFDQSKPSLTLVTTMCMGTNMSDQNLEICQ